MSLSIVNLERALRKGRTPDDLGAVTLKRGQQKTGYLYTLSNGTKVIIKLNTGGWQNEKQIRPPNLQKYGCATIYQTRAGEYIIQEFVTQLQKRDDPAWKVYREIRINEKGDYHTGNFGT